MRFYGTQFEYHHKIYEICSIVLERMAAVPIGNTEEENAKVSISLVHKKNYSY
jgi:hypothetical protein